MIADDARDRDLLAAHLRGDPHAFGTLVGLHRDRMYAVAVRTLSGSPNARDEAADAVQDALLSAYRAAGSYRGQAQVSTWLHRIVVNACLDRLRKRAIRPTLPLPDREPADPRDPLGESETATDVHAALAGLPVEQRAAIVLVDLTGFPVERAAEILGVPVGTVKSRCSRGRARLAVALGHLRNPEAAAAVPQDVDPPRGADRPQPGGGP